MCCIIKYTSFLALLFERNIYLKETNDSFHRLTLANSLRQTQVKKLKMKISYKKKYEFQSNFRVDVVSLVFYRILTTDKPNWTDYGWIVISAMYLSFILPKAK
jgi:hypothetical protein